MQVQKIIVRIAKDGELTIFLPEDHVNRYKIGCYAVMGEHGEASMEYYQGCKPADDAHTAQGIRIYQNVLYSRRMAYKVVAVKRDSYKMKRLRWQI